MENELLKYCQKKNILLDSNLLNIFDNLDNLDKTKLFVEKISNLLGKKFLTKNDLSNNKSVLYNLIKDIFLGDSEKFNYLCNIFELNDNKRSKQNSNKEKVIEEKPNIKIVSSYLKPGKELAVKDFVTYFKNRYSDFAQILQDRSELENLTSIGKISTDKQKISVIGMVSDKRQTKNGNLILEIEDLTGNMKVLISSQKEDLIKEAEDIVLDSILGFKGLGNNEILFVNEIVFPETRLPERKKSPEEEYALFIGDIHYGSHNFMSKSFDKFIEYLNGNIYDDPKIKKIKYLFIVGDLITGIGNYPNQEQDLIIDNLEDQFIGIANLLKKIRKDIQIIISPGNHDCVRIMEPQPLLDEKYAWPLYDMENVTITENPAIVNIAKKENFEGFNVLTYHGFSFPYYANTVPKLMINKTMNDPIQIMKYLLKLRHLAPTHTSTQYFPMEKDPLLIRKAPDIFVSGHTHKSGVTYENNVLVISASTWEGLTPYQEKFGNKPDHCKVPMINLKTRAVKILDFETEQGGIKTYSEEKDE